MCYNSPLCEAIYNICSYNYRPGGSMQGCRNRGPGGGCLTPCWVGQRRAAPTLPPCMSPPPPPPRLCRPTACPMHLGFNTVCSGLIFFCFALFMLKCPFASFLPHPSSNVPVALPIGLCILSEGGGGFPTLPWLRAFAPYSESRIPFSVGPAGVSDIGGSLNLPAQVVKWL